MVVVVLLLLLLLLICDATGRLWRQTVGVGSACPTPTNHGVYNYCWLAVVVAVVVVVVVVVVVATAAAAVVVVFVVVSHRPGARTTTTSRLSELPSFRKSCPTALCSRR